MKRKIRVLICKCGLDAHDRGVKIVARALRDAGMEVIYTGLHYEPSLVVKTAVEEDVDVIGVSCHSGAHNTIFKKIIDNLKKNKVKDVLLIGGGVISEKDILKLKKMGVEKIFWPGTFTTEIVSYIEERFSKLQRQAAR